MATPITIVNIIPLEIQNVPEPDTGANGDIAVDQPNGIIYQKINGTWTQIWPTVT